MLRIERQDKQLDPRTEEIRQNWRGWAREHGYVKSASIPLQQGSSSVILETWMNASLQEDAYLLYIPSIPETVSDETLYILTDQEQVTLMLDAAKKMVAVALAMVRYKKNQRQNRMN